MPKTWLSRSLSLLVVVIYCLNCKPNVDNLSAAETTKKCIEAINAQKFSEVKDLTTDESNTFIDLYRVALLTGAAGSFEIFKDETITYTEEKKDEKQSWVIVKNKEGTQLTKLLVNRVDKHWEVNLSAEALVQDAVESTPIINSSTDPDEILNNSKHYKAKADSIKEAMKKEFSLTDDEIEKMSRELQKSAQ